MKDLSLSKKLLDSVSGVLKDSSKAMAEQSKAAASQLSSKYSQTIARPLSKDEAKVAAMESRAPAKRVFDSISQVYAKSVAEANEQAKAEAAAIQKAYSKLGSAKPISEEKKTDIIINPQHPETVKKRQAKMQADVSDETILDGEVIDEKAHTVPKTEKEKKLASLAEPKDKITHADVMTGRGVRREGFEHMDAFLKKKKEQEGTGKFEKKKISTGTVYTKKPEKEQKVDEAMQKSDIPAYLRKQKGEKPLTVADVKGPRPDSISSKEALAKARGVKEEAELEEARATGSKMKLRLFGPKKLSSHIDPNDTPGQHQCAIHVKHVKLGEGKTLFSQHAEPNAEGLIEWYDVMFEHGIEKKVPTAELEILVSESHMNHPAKKKGSM